MKRYSIKIITSISKYELDKRLREIYNLKTERDYITKRNYFRLVKHLLKKKYQEEIITDEDVFQEMIRMRDSPTFTPQPNLILRQQLTDIFGAMTEEEFQKKENIFYQYKTKFKKENPEITHDDILDYMRRSYNREIKRGKTANQYVEDQLKEIYGELSEREFKIKKNLFSQYKRKLKEQNPETTDNDVLQFMREIKKRSDEREQKKKQIEENTPDIIASSYKFIKI